MPSSELTVGVALIKLLEQYRVKHVFGIPGVHTIELYRGLAGSSIQHHTPRHEQGAGFMADGYARVSRQPGVCFVITGPGLTNIATPMGQALADSIPMLVISSVNDTITSPQAQGMLHEMPDQLALSAQVARYSETISSADDLAAALAKAFNLFASSRPGPVHLQLPVSLLGSPANPSLIAEQPQLASRPVASVAEVKAAAGLLKNAQHPTILAGGGSVEASQQVRLLAEKLNAPVHMTINARGVLPFSHELAVPASCTYHSVREVLNESDVVLALGTELSATDYDQFKDDQFKISARLVRCDIDPLQINNNFTAELSLVGDVGLTLQKLLDEIDLVEQDSDRAGLEVSATVKKDNNGESSGVSRARRSMQALAQMSAPERRHLQILEAMRDQIPDCIFVGDSTQMIYSGNMIFNTHEPGRWFNSSVGFGTLGYALPAATGAALASDNAPVVCLIGDGGMQFVLGELGALKDTGKAVAVVVWCNGGYLEIKNSMERADVSAVGVEFTVPDYLSVARAYGIDSVRASNAQEICTAIQQHYEKNVPVVVVVDEEQALQAG